MLIFEGREFARKKERDFKNLVLALRKKGITPKLVSILVGDNPGNLLYTSLKKKAAERIGCKMEVKEFPENVALDQLNQLINQLNNDNSTHGIMVQLPLPSNLKEKTQDLIEKIDPVKDVDGLREDSKFTPATVKAVLQIIEEVRLRVASARQAKNVVVVGSEGIVGRKLMNELRSKNYKIYGIDLHTKYDIRNTEQADILISATGNPELIKENMVKEGVVLIDVGSPVGDIDKKAYKKASFVSPVPGGVGPVTISSLLENLIESATIHSS